MRSIAGFFLFGHPMEVRPDRTKLVSGQSSHRKIFSEAPEANFRALMKIKPRTIRSIAGFFLFGHPGKKSECESEV
jgi:hypothetical protein